MKGFRSVGAILVVAGLAVTIGATSALSGDDPQWMKALTARSEALNRQHGAGEYSTTQVRISPDWIRGLAARSEALNRRYGLGRHARLGQADLGLIARSDALNRKYGLGEYALKTTAVESTSEPAWQRALRLRSEALNRMYGLGEYAPKSP